MRAFSVTTSIRSTPERIWALLTDAGQYPAWNNTVSKIDGRIAPGERITVHAKINPGRAFPVNVAEFSPSKRMVWSGGMPLGLFKGTRTFTLSPGSAGNVEFSMREEYTGLFQVKLIPPRDESDSFKNPIGVYVTNFTWSREFSGGIMRDDSLRVAPSPSVPTNPANGGMP